MAFYQNLRHNTTVEAQGVYASPILHSGAEGNISLSTCLNFLSESCQLRPGAEQSATNDVLNTLRTEKQSYTDILLNDIRNADSDAGANHNPCCTPKP